MSPGGTRGEPILDSFAVGFTAFFFLFFLQGQVLRVSKNVRDEDNTNELFNRFDTLHEALGALAAQRSEDYPPTITQEPPPPSTPTAALPLIDQARRAVNEGFLYPAVLLASIAFEQAVRIAAAALEIDTRRPLSFLVREIGIRLQGRGMSKELEILVRLRNSLVHPTGKTTQLDQVEAGELVENFALSIEWLRRVASGNPYTTPYPS